MMKKALFLLVAFTVVAGVVVAEEGEQKMAVNANVFGIIGGSYVANFEYHALPWLGTMAELGFFARDGSTGFVASVHPRLHARQKFDSVFLAPFLRFQLFSGVVTENNVDYDFSSTAITLGGNLGKRWIFGPGISVVVRLGWGPSFINTTYDDAEPVSKDLVDDLLGIFAGFDGELSLGYAF